MAKERNNTLNQILREEESGVLQAWIDLQLSAAGFRADRVSPAEITDQSRQFLATLVESVEKGGDDVQGPAWSSTRHFLEELSTDRAVQGFSPADTAMFVFSLKQVIFDKVRARLAGSPDALAAVTWQASTILDRLGLYTTEAYQQRREQVIVRQQQEMLELSTPVVTLWEGILMLPLIGTLDSARTQVVMENLLERIVQSGASIAIIDITGVPTVDTVTAQHLLKTVAAARLMGADCIISGIRPQIAQTIVHLGVELSSVTTKATIEDAFRIALRRRGLAVARVSSREVEGEQRPPAQAGEKDKD